MSLTDRGKARCSESCTAGLERGVEKRAVLCEKQSHQSDATRSAPTLLKGTSPVRRRLRHEVAYVFVVLDNHDATQCSAIGTLPG
jgi:hypothetical protein